MIVIDRHEYSSYDIELEDHRHYVKYDKENEENNIHIRPAKRVII